MAIRAEREEDRISIGRILRPWGRAGAVVVEPWTHDAHRFENLGETELSGPDGARSCQIEWLRTDPAGRPVLRVDGVDSIGAAERLRGAEISIPAERAQRPAGVSWFVHELLGLEAFAGDGERLGRVEEVVATGATPLLVIRDGVRETLLPLAAEFVAAVDLAAGRISLSPPEGLVGLNDTEVRHAV